jgi:hypothetical protein
MCEEMATEERVFRSHIELGPFQSGVARGRWRLLSINWPMIVIAVAAAPRSSAPNEYALRFDLLNYPQSPPTAIPWDAVKDSRMADQSRPNGKCRVAKAFRTDWKNGEALYLPCDRGAIDGHGGWVEQHPEMIWDPNGDITQYLRIVHELLTSSDYTGPRSPQT